MTQAGESGRGLARCGILLVVLWIGTLPAGADPPLLQGPTFLPGDGGRDTASGNQEEVAVAAGGSGFLVAWTDMRTSNFGYIDQTGNDVYAARLARGAGPGGRHRGRLVVWRHAVKSRSSVSAGMPRPLVRCGGRRGSVAILPGNSEGS